jgi:hypothetical protein
MALFRVDHRERMFLFCSYGVKPPFKPPWTLVRENSEDANGVTLAWPLLP